MSRTNCVYCNKPITTRSSEHVIHNALGGLYESEDICCPECNNYISRCIDAEFTKIFNPVIGRIENFSKTRNSKNPPSYSGIVSYNGKDYNAIFKNGKVVSCPTLSKELKCGANISKIPLKTVAYNFNLDGQIFQNGIAKIAFNYALDKGIDLNLLKDGLNVQQTTNGLGQITFNYPVVPFYPLNPVDEFLELHTPMTLYHNMILFSQNNYLWCYIDLFNTFQYYVMLTDKFPEDEEVHETYAQTLQKLDRSAPQMNISRQKDILLYAQDYGVEPCTDLVEFERRVKNAIAQKSQKVPLQNLIESKIAGMTMPFYFVAHGFDPNKLGAIAQSLPLYFDEDDKLHLDAFRTVTYCPGEKGLWPYPHALMHKMPLDAIPVKKYTSAKMRRLTSSLNKKTK